MEFIIVLPIYFLLLGFAFVIGELSLHSIHLAASGDRNVAFVQVDTTDNAQFWRRLRRVISPNREAIKRPDTDADEEDLLLSYQGDEVYQGRTSVSQFNETLDTAQKAMLPSGGHWTEAVGGRAIDDYTLSPVTRGMVAHWFYETERRVYEGKLMSESFDRPEKDDLDTILDKASRSLGRAKVKGNYYEDNAAMRIRHYGYHSLRRTEAGHDVRTGDGYDNVVSYRAWSPGKLAGGGWKRAAVTVDGEQGATVDGDGIRETERGDSQPSWSQGEKGSGDPVSYDFSDLL